MIKHIEKYTFSKDGESGVSGERPRYYHATLDCLLFRHPYFTYSMLQVDPELFQSLIQANKDLINALKCEADLITFFPVFILTDLTFMFILPFNNKEKHFPHEGFCIIHMETAESISIRIVNPSPIFNLI